jgi:nicotinamide mononucleotide adenylyltransferase
LRKKEAVKRVIKNFSQYLVEEEREVFFTFGRMNPPTIGHGKLIDTLVKKSKGADYKIYVSQSQDPKKNPLSYSDKIKHLRKMFPKNGRNIIVDKTARNAIDIAVKLYDMGYKKITMVVGDDQVRTFDVLLNKYNGKKARHGFYNFESINIVSAGRRDPDAEGVEGMSATKMRQAATDNDYQTFAQGIPKSMSDKDTRKLFNDVRKGMGLKEERSFKRHIDLGKLTTPVRHMFRVTSLNLEILLLSKKAKKSVSYLFWVRTMSSLSVVIRNSASGWTQ